MVVKLDVSAKAHKVEEAEVSSCVSNLIQAFSNGLNVFKRLRERRRKRKAHKENPPLETANSDELQLSKSLRRGPQELAERYDACYSQTGQSFAKGDAIAHATLAETLIKLNTGLVAIIASFLNHDPKGGKTPLNLDYKSLTNLSDASRREALQSMTQLYQRLSQSQLQLQHFSGPSACVGCESRKHNDCSTRSSSSSSSIKDKKKHATTRQRVTGPTIARMPLRSSSQPQLVVVRPRPSRKNSTSSSSSKSHSPSTSTSASTCTSPLASPLPLYIAEEPFRIETNGIIKGVLGAPMPPLAGSGRRRKDSFHESRPSTWPEYDYLDYPYVIQEHAPLPKHKLPSFVPASPRKPSATPVPTSTTHKKSSSPPPRPPKPASLSSPPNQKYPPVSAAAVARRRIDKVTPSSYTFASDSTKLGEIPQRNWTVPWDYEEAERLNMEAAVVGHPAAVREESLKGDASGKKKGLLRRWRRGSVDV